MKLRNHYLLLLFVLFLAVLIGCQGGDAAEKSKADAINAASHWLALVDQGKYAEAWDGAADAIKKAGDKQQFAAAMRAQREPMGKVTSRALEASQYAKDPQNFPPGEYVELKYKTAFQNAPSAEELLQLVKAPDGSWKVGAYFPKQNQ
jgi:Protein of unknown function (DUF4019)